MRFIKQESKLNNQITYIERLPGLTLSVYIVCMTAFEHHHRLSILASLSLYAFFASASLYILMNRKIRFNYYIVGMTSYGMMLLLSYLYTPSEGAALMYLYRYTTLVVIITLVMNYVDNTEKVVQVIKSFVLAGTMLSVMAFMIYGLGIFQQAASSEYGLRIGSEFGNENDVGMAAAFSIFFALYLMVHKLANKKYYLYYVITIIVCLPFALLTGSKKAFFILLIGTLFTLLTNTTKSIWGISRKLKGLTLAIVALAALYFIISNVDAFWYIYTRINELIGTVTGKGNESISDQIRMNMIKTGWDAFGDSPILGKGIYASYSYFGTYSHNNYIEVLMNTGIIGFILYYTPYCISLHRLKKKTIDIEVKALAIIIIITILFLETGAVTYYSRYFHVLLATISSFVCYNGVKRSC